MNSQNQKYLVVKGTGGVGNRFISLMKAIKYAQKTNRHHSELSSVSTKGRASRAGKLIPNRLQSN